MSLWISEFELNLTVIGSSFAIVPCTVDEHDGAGEWTFGSPDFETDFSELCKKINAAYHRQTLPSSTWWAMKCNFHVYELIITYGAASMMSSTCRKSEITKYLYLDCKTFRGIYLIILMRNCQMFW